MSRRDAPQCAVTIQLAGIILLACLSLGTLLGTTVTVQALRPNLRRQAEERRRLNAQWQEVREARQQTRPIRCPRCGSRLR
jgi:hypothetical protein